MPADDRFWSDNAYDIPKLANGAICVFLQSGCQKSQGCPISTIGSDGLMMFAYHEIELMSENDDFQILIVFGVTADTDERQENREDVSDEEPKHKNFLLHKR